MADQVNKQNRVLLPPYIGTKAHLSQLWFNRWTVLLVLVIVRCFVAVEGVSRKLEVAREEALNACIEVESIGSTFASMPHYMAVGINELTADSLELAISGLATALQLSSRALEQILIFVVHMMTSTYLCLITLAVRGSIGAVTESSAKISESVQKVIEEATNSIADEGKSLSDTLNTLADKIGRNPFANGQTLPKVDFTDPINKLKELKLPSDIEDGLVKLNASMPDFEDIQNYIDSIIKIPFATAETYIRNLTSIRLERSILPVPAIKRLDFCKDGNAISDFFQGIVSKVAYWRKIFLGIMVALVAIVCGLTATVDHYWNRETNEAKAALYSANMKTAKECAGDRVEKDTRNAVVKKEEGLILLQAEPSQLWFIGQRFSRRLSGSGKYESAANWFLAYITSSSMVFILVLGFAGLLSCFCQYWVLRLVQRSTPKLTSQVADFGNKVIESLTTSSLLWSRDTNAVVRTLEEQVNKQAFSAVNATTTAINSTINAFVEKMSDTIGSTFGNTVLHEPVKDVIHCLVGLKIASLQQGLAWAQQNARISLPEVRNDSFVATSLTELEGSLSAAALLANANGVAEDKVTRALDGVVTRFATELRTETLTSTALTGIWLLMAVGGALYVLVVLNRELMY